MSSALTFSYDYWRETQRMTYTVMSNGKWDQWRHAVMLVIIRPPRERETKPPPRKGGRYLKPCSNKVFLSLYTNLSLNPQIRNHFMRSVKMGCWDSEWNPIQIEQKLSVAVSFCLMCVYFGWIKPLFWDLMVALSICTAIPKTLEEIQKSHPFLLRSPSALLTRPSHFNLVRWW